MGEFESCEEAKVGGRVVVIVSCSEGSKVEKEVGALVQIPSRAVDGTAVRHTEGCEDEQRLDDDKDGNADGDWEKQTGELRLGK